MQEKGEEEGQFDRSNHSSLAVRQLQIKANNVSALWSSAYLCLYHSPHYTDALYIQVNSAHYIGTTAM